MADPARREGTLDEALANGRRLLPSDPRMALVQVQAILRLAPGDGNALRLAAAAHRALGEAANALNAEMAAIAAGQREPALIAASRALSRDDPAETSRLAAEHLRSSPDDLVALTLSAEAAIAMGLPDKAEPLLRSIVQRAPVFARAGELLLNALMLLDRMEEARTMLQQVMERQPASPVEYRLLYRIESDLGNYAAAAAASERILQTGQAVAEDWVGYGDALRFDSRKAEASAAYRKALALDPAFGRAWWSLADLDPGALGDADLAQMDRALAGTGDPEHAGNLHFALGIGFDARRDAATAFRCFQAGNDARRKAQPYSSDDITRQVDRYLAELPAGAIPARADRAADEPVPIFIVGMPRSGSTLVERILGRHARIEALGELAIVPHMMQRLKLDQPAEELERRIAGLQRAELDELGRRYLERAGEHRKTGRPFFIDKLHMNWRHLPLILRMLPQARIVDVRRDAMDCCWSNYKTLFARGHPAASDLTDIGRFYRDYVRFADALRERAPGRIHLLDYERLVDDIEGETQALFDAIGLPLEPQCLEFHLSNDPVATASSEQVRRPLNRDGIGAWRPYEAWLGPLKEALGDCAHSGY